MTCRIRYNHIDMSARLCSAALGTPDQKAPHTSHLPNSTPQCRREASLRQPELGLEGAHSFCVRIFGESPRQKLRQAVPFSTTVRLEGFAWKDRHVREHLLESRFPHYDGIGENLA